MKRQNDRDDSASVSVRNLGEIQEQEPHQGSSKVAAMVMASFGGACIVFCALMLARSPKTDAPTDSDPLGALVAATPSGAQKKVKRTLALEDVTFPDLLTDQQQKTTALAAVPTASAAASTAAEDELPRGPGREPPPATDNLKVVPLPAQDVLGQEVPRAVPAADTLQTIAQKLSREPAGMPLAAVGESGGYQLQVSSFKSREEGETFATALRRRGHKAHVEEGNVAGRGVWFRVRVGSFKYKRSAQIYREEFEAKERLVTFIVDPPKNAVTISVNDAE